MITTTASGRIFHHTTSTCISASSANEHRLRASPVRLCTRRRRPAAIAPPKPRSNRQQQPAIRALNQALHRPLPIMLLPGSPAARPVVVVRRLAASGTVAPMAHCAAVPPAMLTTALRHHVPGRRLFTWATLSRRTMAPAGEAGRLMAPGTVLERPEGAGQLAGSSPLYNMSLFLQHSAGIGAAVGW
jgi:hypothetical protein